MALPVFVGAGPGTGVLTGTGTISKTDCSAGNFIIVQACSRGNTDDGGLAAPDVNLLGIDGSANNITGFFSGIGPTGILQQIAMGRVAANGTCSVDLRVGASGEDQYGRMYEFSGVSTGTSFSEALENTNPGDREFSTGTSASVDSSFCVTTGPNRLVVTFVGLASNQSIGDFTGETGGNWTEATPEYQDATGSTCTLQLQIAPMAAAGTITGGTAAISSVAWTVATTSLMPNVQPGDDPPIGFLGRGAGW